MEVVSAGDAETAGAIDGVVPSQLASGDRMSVQRYRIEPGATVDEYSHPTSRWAICVRGD